jgi:hypothetical protein
MAMTLWIGMLTVASTLAAATVFAQGAWPDAAGATAQPVPVQPAQNPVTVPSAMPRLVVTPTAPVPSGGPQPRSVPSGGVQAPSVPSGGAQPITVPSAAQPALTPGRAAPTP